MQTAVNLCGILFVFGVSIAFLITQYLNSPKWYGLIVIVGGLGGIIKPFLPATNEELFYLIMGVVFGVGMLFFGYIKIYYTQKLSNFIQQFNINSFGKMFKWMWTN